MAAKSPGYRIPIDGPSQGVAAYAGHKLLNPRKSEFVCLKEQTTNDDG
jgi:hypothetical protein